MALYHQDSEATTVATDDDMLPPPPPPPPIYNESPSRQSSSARYVQDIRFDDTIATRTSKSTTSAASITLQSNASVMSSQTDESEEETYRRVCFKRSSV